MSPTALHNTDKSEYEINHMLMLGVKMVTGCFIFEFLIKERITDWDIELRAEFYQSMPIEINLPMLKWQIAFKVLSQNRHWNQLK